MGKKSKAVSAGKPILVKNVKNVKISTVKYVEAVIIKETMDKVLLSVVNSETHEKDKIKRTDSQASKFF